MVWQLFLKHQFGPTAFNAVIPLLFLLYQIFRYCQQFNFIISLLTGYIIFCIIILGLNPIAKGNLRVVGHFLNKEVIFMDMNVNYIFIFLIMVCVQQIVKYITKKPANTCQEFFEKSLKFIELNFFAQQPDRKNFKNFGLSICIK